MSNPVQVNTTEHSPEMDELYAAEQEAVEYAIPEGDTLERLNVVRTIQSDIEAFEASHTDAVKSKTAFDTRLLKRKDAGVLAIASLLETIPARVVQAKLHQVYGGKLDAKGKASKTTPAGDGDAFLKAAKAYRDASLYIEKGIIPEAWSRGSGQRAAIAEMLDSNDKALLKADIEAKSKIAVSDTITRFFKDYTPRQAPLFMNAEKLQALAEEILVNAEYISGEESLVSEYAALVETIKTVLPKK
jgi:hypothetical protein